MIVLGLDGHGPESIWDEDSAELLDAVQSSFGVELEIDPLLGLTVGELASRISARMRTPETSRCLSSATFYAVRGGLMKVSGSQRKAVRLESRLEDLLPWWNRRALWKSLDKELCWLPRLNYPGWVLVLSLLWPAGILWLTSRYFSFPLSLTWMVTGSFFLALPALRLLEPIARKVPRSSATVRELVETLLAHDFGALAARFGSRSDAEILASLRRLVADETGMRKVTAATRMPDDLWV
jgi:hypothetical protein